MKQEAQVVALTLFGVYSVHSANALSFKYPWITGNCSPSFAAAPHFLAFVPGVELWNISISQSLSKGIPLA